MPSGFLVLANDHRVVYCSNGAATLLTLRPDDIIGRGIEEVLHNHADNDDTGDIVDTLIRIIDGPFGEPLTAEIRLSRPRPIELALAAFPIEPGSGTRIVVLLLEAITYEYQTARQWDTTIAILAHELHSPLTVIKAYSDLMLSETSLNATQREWLENIRASSDRIAALGSGFVSAAHIRSGDVTGSLETLPIREAIDRTVALTAPTAASHIFEVEVGAELPIVLADRFRFDQVLRNLLDNAVKYSPPGSRVTIVARHQPEGQRLIIGVNDQGIGIAPKDQKRIFAPHERIERVETENIWGAGLGLFIVKELAELMGGEAWVESELNRGSTFFFSLPATSEEVVQGQSQNGGECQ